jgi:hypothetical protein
MEYMEPFTIASHVGCGPPSGFIYKCVYNYTIMRTGLLLLLVASCAGELYMIVEYDTNGTARSTLGDFKLHTVELQVTLLGCDYGYYAETIQPLECRECVCAEYVEGRREEFVQGDG